MIFTNNSLRQYCSDALFPPYLAVAAAAMRYTRCQSTPFFVYLFIFCTQMSRGFFPPRCFLFPFLLIKPIPPRFFVFLSFT